MDTSSTKMNHVGLLPRHGKCDTQTKSERGSGGHAYSFITYSLLLLSDCCVVFRQTVAVFALPPKYFLVSFAQFIKCLLKTGCLSI